MRSHFRSIWKLLENHRIKYCMAIIAMVIASCFLYLVPLIPQITIDGVLADNTDKASSFVKQAVPMLGGRAFLQQNLWMMALLILIVSTIAGVFTYLRGRWAAQASESIILNLRDKVYSHLQHLSASYYDKTDTGDLIQRCTSDVETLRLFLSSQVVEIGRALIMLLVPLPLMFAMSVPMTLVSICVLPFIVWFSLHFFFRFKAAFQEADEAEGELTTTIQENLSGIRVVRAFARQDFECEKFGANNQKHRELNYRTYALMARFWSTSDVLCFLQQGLVVGFGIYWVAVGSLPVGSFYFFLSSVAMFLWPVRVMGRILSDLGKALVALERIEEILEVESEHESTKIAPIQRPEQVDIVFDNVSFSHGDVPILRDLSFRVKPGQVLGIVGQSGAGKSTIVELLLRLYDYDTGSIRFAGHELKELPKKWSRNEIAVVMQEPFLYSKTVRDNVLLGATLSSESKVEEVTEMACIRSSIEGFEHGFDTKIGERGVTLSGGQRQRLALARALIQDAGVLILDDSMSAVDTETEVRLRDALMRRNHDQTTLLIAHRLSSVMHADQIIVLDQGSVIQRGTHKELLEQDGWYRKLWRMQRAAEEQALVTEPKEVQEPKQQDEALEVPVTSAKTATLDGKSPLAA